MKKFTVETDHKPLIPIYMTTRKFCPPRLERHKLSLQGYNYDLTWKRGKINLEGDIGPTVNDYTSRHPAPSR